MIVDQRGIEPLTSALRTRHYTTKPLARKRTIIRASFNHLHKTNNIAAFRIYIIMTHDMIIIGAHIVTPNGILERNIVIDEAKIVSITTDQPQCDTKIRADGLVALPGLVDTHVHYGVYTPIDKAATTESHAAAIGGITTMMRMLRTSGAYNNVLSEQLDASKDSHHINYAIHASIFNDSQVDEMKYCADAGVASFKIYMNLGGEIGHVYMDTAPRATKLDEARVEMTVPLIDNIIRNAGQLELPVCVHAEDYESCACSMHESQQDGKDGLGAWSESRSPEYEAKAIQTVCQMARKHNTRIYFVHIGSARALEQIRLEKAQGTKIHVETCPHYLTITHEGRSDYLAKVMPPVRTKSDIEAVWTALCSGQIDTMGTDHVANTRSSKLGDSENVWGALAGFPGIGALLPILLSEGVNRNRLTLEQLARITSTNAAEIFSIGAQKGSLVVGADADITIADTRLEKVLDHEIFGGHSDYSVYDGMTLQGWPVKTIVGGNLVADDFEVIGKPGIGSFVSPISSVE